MKESKNILIAFLGAILIGGAGFFGGTLYQKSITPKADYARRSNVGTPVGVNRNGFEGQRVGGMGFRPITGEIISKDDKSITVKLQDGSSKIVLLAAATQINKAEKADIANLVVGATVRVIGNTNADGSVTAQDVQLNPLQLQRGQNQQNQ